MSKKLGRILGPIGLLLLIFAVFNRVFISGEMNWLVWLHLGLGLACVAIWIATAFEDARRLATGRGSVFVVTSTVTVIALLAILVGLNYFVSTKRVEFDLTKNKIFTLADETQKLLKGLTPSTKVTVTALFASVDPQYEKVSDLLRRYKNYGGENFEYEFVDPEKNPDKVKALGATDGSARIFLKCANLKTSRAKEASEEALTTAIMELTNGPDRKIYFLTGHGEKGVAKAADPRYGYKIWNEGMLNEGLKTEDLNLLEKHDVPEDAQALIIGGPQFTLQPEEIQAVKKYAENGGHLMVMLDPGYDSGLEPLIKSWGVELQPGLILDPATNALPIAVAQEFGDHPVSKARLNGLVLDLFPEARGMKKEVTPGYDVTELFKTSDKAWIRMKPIDQNEQAQDIHPEPGDQMGPITLADAITHKAGEKEMRVLVFGDSDFATDNYIRTLGNRDVALNSLQWLVGETSKITIRPKMRDKSTIANFTATQTMALTFVSLELLPLLLIALGMSVWVVRRAK